MERLSISISSHMKKQLEVMAKTNFRNLNGEINKALDDYIRRNGVSVVENAPNWWEGNVKEQEYQPQEQSIEPIKHRHEPVVHQKAPTITTLHTSDEIEEF